MRPIIGITPSAQTDALAHGTFRRYILSSPYVRAVEAAGGVPLILPPQSEGAEAISHIIDGLILSGGADIAPARYGDVSIHPETYGVDDERDQFELALFDAMLRRQKPIFGICRGIQVINVALGGTLIQDVASQHPGAVEVGHRQHERGLEDSAIGHTVLASESDALPIFEHGRLGVNSFHHQAIRDLAPALIPVAHSPDGLVEAVVMADQPTVFAVQWHPELMFQQHQEHLRGFARLVEAAAAGKLAATTV
jgi:putative glutamine amidotransferase